MSETKRQDEQKVEPILAAPAVRYRASTTSPGLNAAIEAGMQAAGDRLKEPELKSLDNQHRRLETMKAFEFAFFRTMLEHLKDPVIQGLAMARMFASKPYNSKKVGEHVPAWSIVFLESHNGRTYTFRPEEPDEVKNRMFEAGVRIHRFVKDRKKVFGTKIRNALKPVRTAVLEGREKTLEVNRPTSPPRPGG